MNRIEIWTSCDFSKDQIFFICFLFYLPTGLNWQPFAEVVHHQLSKKKNDFFLNMLLENIIILKTYSMYA